MKTLIPTKNLFTLLLTGTLLLFSTLVFAQENGEISGTIKDPKTGENISFAKVTLTQSDSVIANDVTALSGTYKFEDLEEGKYKIEVQKGGYIVYSTFVTVSNETLTRDISLTTPEVAEKLVLEDEKAHHEERVTTHAWTDGDADVFTTSKKSHKKDKWGATPTTAIGGTSELSYSYDAVAVDAPAYFSPASGETSIAIDDYETISTGFSDGTIAKGEVGEIPGIAATESGKSTFRAGQLTAGEIHDFSKWDLWNDVAEDKLSEWQSYWSMNPTTRFSIQLVTDAGWPVVDQQVWLMDSKKNIVWTTRTDNTGKAELWAGIFKNEDSKNYSIVTKYNGKNYSVDGAKQFQDGINTLTIDRSCKVSKVVDIAFVVDATSSMGDEINYLKAELNDVIQKAKTNNADLKFNLGSVFYRDKGDAYLTRKSDFSSKIENTIDFIKAQRGGGGGDYPEAVDAALDVAVNNLEWSTDARARLLFLVLDAPPHHDDETVKKLQEVTRAAAKKGIRIIPITASGIDKRTEYLMRSFALATNGTYTFLTDHSGIGGSHIEPTTDSYDVELLNDLLIRLIDQFTSSVGCDEEQLLAQDPDVVKDPQFNGNPNNNSDTANTTVGNDSIHTDTTFNGHIGQNGDPNNINDTTDTNQLADAIEIKCYPNPTMGELTVEVSKEVPELFITDITGKILMRHQNPAIGSRIEFNLTGYASGFYFVHAQYNDKLVSEKIVLMR